MSSGKLICFTDSRGNRFLRFRTVLFCVWSYGNGDSSCAFAVTTARNRWK